LISLPAARQERLLSVGFVAPTHRRSARPRVQPLEVATTTTCGRRSHAWPSGRGRRKRKADRSRQNAPPSRGGEPDGSLGVRLRSCCDLLSLMRRRMINARLQLAACRRLNRNLAQVWNGTGPQPLTNRALRDVYGLRSGVLSRVVGEEFVGSHA
jgi:hypothetical protein